MFNNGVLLVLDDFDPVSNYKLELIKQALHIEQSIDSIVFMHHSFKGNVDRVFTQEEKVALLSSCIPNTPVPKYLIDGESFKNTNLSIVEKISRQSSLHKTSNLFLLLDTKEYHILEQSTSEWHYLINKVTIILYVLPEHRELTEKYSITSKSILFINATDYLNTLSKASILNVSSEAFSSTIIEYMNKSGECAIKRIKFHLSEKRFKHSLRVAGTIKHICELVKEEDEEFKYDAYLAALYHDICKELSPDIQRQIASDTLFISPETHWKVLHGPIGAWYIKSKYLFNNEDILEAIEQHTVPSQNPKKMTIFIYLADHLETAKQSRYSDGVYDQAWKIIGERRPEEAFYFLINYFKDLNQFNTKSN